jgi:hypothetical protein
MNDIQKHSGWLRRIDRGPRWGSFDVYPSRYGVTRYRLVVFPPGISAEDRRLLRLWRSWPIWGMVLFLVSELFLTQLASAGMALVVAAVLAIGPGAAAMVLTTHVRTRVRSLSVVRVAGYPDAATMFAFSELTALAETLADADTRHSRGDLSAVDHEAAVWRVYEQMAPDVPQSSAR